MEIVNCPISENAVRSADAVALINNDQSWTYQELDAAIQNLCSFLKHLGIKENHRVAFIATSTPETICLFFALFRLGAIACPLSSRIPQEQVSKHLDLLKPSYVLETAKLNIDTTFRHCTTSSNLNFGFLSSESAEIFDEIL